jgi:hypothetical protein
VSHGSKSRKDSIRPPKQKSLELPLNSYTDEREAADERRVQDPEGALEVNYRPCVLFDASMELRFRFR